MNADNAFGDNVDRYEMWFRKNNYIFDSEINAVRQLLPDSGRGIEIGVGTGLFASALGILEGVEPSAEMAEIAASRGLKVTKASAEKLPLPGNVYKYALMVTVDCFLDDVRQAFSEVLRILIDDGIFVIAFIDRATGLGQQYDQRKLTDEFYKHANFHSAAEMNSLLEESGFDILDQRQTVFTLENKLHEVKKGTGKGVFAVIKTRKK